MARFLASSVQSVLQQTYTHLELIVVDDGSTDGTKDALGPFMSDPRFRYHHQRNRGAAAARNTGIRMAQGELIAFNDADDLWYREKLERQLPLFKASEQVGVVYSERDVIDEHGAKIPTRRVERRRGAALSGRILVENFVTNSSAVLRRDCIERFGVFDESLKRSEDFDLWLRYSLYYAFDFVPEPLMAHRKWPDQMTKDKSLVFEANFLIQERFLRDHPGVVSRRDANRAWANRYTSRGRWLASRGQRVAASRDFRSALKHRPTHIPAVKELIKLIAGTRE